MLEFGFAPKALDAVDEEAVFCDDELVRVGGLFDPVVAPEARLDRAVIGGKAAGRDLCVRDNPALPCRIAASVAFEQSS